MGHAPRCRGTSAIVLGAALASCVEALDRPDPPDMEALIALYGAPTAALTADNIGELQRELGRRLVVLRDLCRWNARAVERFCAEDDCLLCSGLTPLYDTFAALAADTDDSEDVNRWVRGLDGFLRVTRVCRGWQAQPTRELENGTLELVMGFDARGFDPVFGGELIGCRTLLGGEPVTLDGQLDLAFERRFGFRELPRLDPIVRARGRARWSDRESAFQAHFRVSAVDGADLALAFELGDDGTMLALTGSSGLGVQAANGLFSCELAPPQQRELTCLNLASGERVP